MSGGPRLCPMLLAGCASCSWTCGHDIEPHEGSWWVRAMEWVRAHGEEEWDPRGDLLQWERELGCRCERERTGREEAPWGEGTEGGGPAGGDRDSGRRRGRREAAPREGSCPEEALEQGSGEGPAPRRGGPCVGAGRAEGLVPGALGRGGCEWAPGSVASFRPLVSGKRAWRLRAPLRMRHNSLTGVSGHLIFELILGNWIKTICLKT